VINIFRIYNINLPRHRSTIMGFNIASLWQAPEINPVNGKARSIPIFNPINKYGRVFVSSPAITVFLYR
jgi:hypothetical protein